VSGGQSQSNGGSTGNFGDDRTEPGIWRTLVPIPARFGNGQIL